jgi:eukaryotic-like serine/threonine-protein kinase
MRFIRGDSLKEAIDRYHSEPGLKNDRGRRSLELRKLLRRFIDVCNAIDYAHARGVLHRDIKPANIILGTHGETLVVDWGLAKPLGRGQPDHDSPERTLMPSGASGSTETLPGSALGTPAFMSPEQAEGQPDRLGPQSDVYSLGATLYCLLTGRAPFGGDVAQVFRHVRRGDFRPHRAVEASIDRALEAVCLKAMALQPGERYGSCRALAEDVERWMAGEPVTAWREPFSVRVRRWARRNRTAVTAAVVALLVALAGTAAVLAVQTRANVKLTAANEALANANMKVQHSNTELKAANTRERQRFDLAMEAIKLFHGEVSEDLLLKQKAFEALRTKLLRGAADFYGKLEGLLKGQTDPASRAGVGKAYEELGNLMAMIGSRAEALAVHRKGLAARRALARLPAATCQAKLDVVRSLKCVGSLQAVTGDTAGALASYQEADLLAEELEAAQTSDSTQAVLADVHSVTARLFRETGKPAEALAEYAKALAIRLKLASTDPNNAQVQDALAASSNGLAGVLLLMGQRAQALASYEKARSIRQSLVAKIPGSTALQRSLAIDHFNVGVGLARAGKSADALASYEKARAIWLALVDANPAVTELQDDLADAHYAVGIELASAGRHREALAADESARALWQALVAANRKVTKFESHEANALVSIANLKERLGMPAEAMLLFDQARVIYQSLADAEPRVTEFQSELALTLVHVGRLSSQIGRGAEALENYERARAIQQALVDANPAIEGFQSALATTLASLGRMRQADGRLAEAAEAYRKGASIMEHLAMRSEQDRYNLGCLLSLLAGIAGRPGAFDGGRTGWGGPGHGLAAEGSRRWLHRRDALANRHRPRPTPIAA